MIGFFTIIGDSDTGNNFLYYVKEFSKIIKNIISEDYYGQDISLILIEYRLEGKFLKIPNEQYKFVSYRKRERSIGIVINVPLAYQTLSEIMEKEFIIITSTNAVRLARDTMNKKGYSNFDFERLLADLEKCSNTFLSLTKEMDK